LKRPFLGTEQEMNRNPRQNLSSISQIKSQFIIFFYLFSSRVAVFETRLRLRVGMRWFRRGGRWRRQIRQNVPILQFKFGGSAAIWRQNY